jgi:hypothetical protein
MKTRQLRYFNLGILLLLGMAAGACKKKVVATPTRRGAFGQPGGGTDQH